MLKKEYFKLKELSVKTSIDDYDYDYVVKQVKETLYIDLYAQPILLIEPILNSNESEIPTLDELTGIANQLENLNTQFQGICVGEYTGIARLIKHDKKSILRRKSVTIETVILDNIKGLKQINNTYPFKDELPNSIVQEWSGDIKSIANGVKAYLIEDLMDSLIIEPKLISLDDIIIPEHQEKHIMALLHKDVKPQKEQQLITLKRPIDNLLLRLLEAFPNDKPSEIWIKLKVDLNNEPRIFDIDEIIDEVGEDILYWFDNHSEIKQIKKKSFYNLINKIRINL